MVAAASSMSRRSYLPAVVGRARASLSTRLAGVRELALREEREQPPRLDDLLARGRASRERTGRRLAEALEREVALQQRRAAALGVAHERRRRLVEHLVVAGHGRRGQRAKPALPGGDALGLDEEAGPQLAVQPAP